MAPLLRSVGELHTSPTVHLNGDKASELFRQQANVKAAAAQLIRALREAWPHGRNYPAMPAQAERLTWDQQLIQSQIEAVQAIIVSAEATCLHIDEQGA